jgi:hypothetical protein
MVIILFFLLVAVWAAVLLPSVVNVRRESQVNSTTRPEPGRAPATRGGSADVRQKVLARRRYALIALGLGAVVSLIGAIVTGSFPLLIVTLLFDVALAAYVAILLQIKQRKQVYAPDAAYRDEDTPVQVAGG